MAEGGHPICTGMPGTGVPGIGVPGIVPRPGAEMLAFEEMLEVEPNRTSPAPPPPTGEPGMADNDEPA